MAAAREAEAMNEKDNDEAVMAGEKDTERIQREAGGRNTLPMFGTVRDEPMRLVVVDAEENG